MVFYIFEEIEKMINIIMLDNLCLTISYLACIGRLIIPSSIHFRKGQYNGTDRSCIKL